MATPIHKSTSKPYLLFNTDIIQNNDHKLLQINGIPDHIHILFGMRAVQSLSDLMKQD